MPVVILRRPKSKPVAGAKAKRRAVPVVKTVQTSAQAHRRSASAYAHLRERVDRLAEVEAALARMDRKAQPLREEAADIRAEFTKAVDSIDGARLGTVIPGTEFEADVSSRAKAVTKTDKALLRKLMGKAYDAEAAVPIGTARRYLTAEQQARVFTETYTGSRRIVVRPRKARKPRK